MSDLKNALVDYADEYDITDTDAFAVYVEYLGGFEYIEQAAIDFADAYQGCYSSLVEFVEEYLESTNPSLIKALHDNYLRLEIDEIAWEQDYYFDNSTGYVFLTYV